MSTALRIIILVVEVIAYIAIFWLKNRSLNKKHDYTDLDKKRRYVEFGMTSLTLLIGIIFLFPGHIFLSYKKIISVTAFIVLASIWFLNNKLRKGFYRDSIFSFMYLVITGVVLGTSIITISDANSSILEPSILDPMVLVDSDFTTENFKVEDDLKSIGDSKIAEIIDEDGKTINYFFIIEDESGNTIMKVVKPTEVRYEHYNRTNEHAYIEKWVRTSVYAHSERKSPNEEKVESIEYVFAINENLITKIKM